MQDGWTHVQHVMGMPVSYDVRSCAPRDPDVQRAIGDAEAWLVRVDVTFSTYIDRSEINRIDRGQLALGDASSEVREVLAIGEELRLLTGGYFDVRATGRLDPSGVVKGWAVERASAGLERAGVGDHCINAAGDIRTRGPRRWRIGIAHPLIGGALSAVIEVAGAAVATSGISERGLHVWDPVGQRAAAELASVTVVGPDLTMADGFATAAVAMGARARDWLQTIGSIEALVIDADGGAWSTPGWDALRAD